MLGAPSAPMAEAPPMMLSMARAATCRLSIGFSGLYGWCRFSDHATSAPWVGVIGSSPCRPVVVSLNCELFSLESREKTHRTCCVCLAQAKLTWPGSDITSGLPQAVVISDLTVATLAGHDAPLLSTIVTTTMITTSRAEPAPIRNLRCRQRLGR